MSNPIRIDPEVRALLEGIAGDAGARLLRAAPGEVRRGLFERAPRVSSTAPFLRNAERHLLEAYREDVGRLLYRYGYILRTRSPDASALHHYGDQTREAPRGEDVREEAVKALGAPQSEELDADVVRLLEGCLRDAASVSPSQVMTAALRVAPSHAIRKCLAMDTLMDGGSVETTKKALEGILEQRPSATIESYVLEGLGFLANRGEDHSAASSLYRAAVAHDEDRIMPVLFWLASSLQAGDREGSLEAAAQAEVIPASSTSVQWYKTELVELRGRAWEPTPGSRALILSLLATISGQQQGK